MDNEKLAQFSDDSVDVDVSTKEPQNAVINEEKELTGELPDNSKKQSPNEFSRASEVEFMNSVIVNNEKVRYYYNKTLCLREPIGNILDTLEVLHSTIFAYLSQLPETGDYSVISTLFELIPTISGMVDWTNLNHSCYWEDFCRETKQLMRLLDKVNGAALKCSDAATDIMRQANELFQDIPDNRNNRPLSTRIDNAIAFKKESDYTNENVSGQSIQINWQKPGDVIELMWHDADGGLLNVTLKQTGTGFRLRFLRHIIYHARGLLERAYLLFMKLSVALHLHIPMDKLAKCRHVQLKQLTQQEHTCLVKAKREFDSSLDLVWQLISRVMSSGIQAQANEESFDFTVFPDRTEDIVAKIEDLLTVDTGNYRELYVLLSIARLTLPSERFNFTAKEKASTDDEVAMILTHRFQVRRSLKMALQVFEKHAAFYKMEQLKLLTPVKHISAKRHSYVANENSDGSDAPLESLSNNGMKTDENNNNDSLSGPEKIWFSIEGGVQVTIHDQRGILTKFSSNDNAIKSYNNLTTDEKVILCLRVVRQLLVCIANEQYMSKVYAGRIEETKSLVKRLKIKDRQNVDLQKVILEQNKYLRQMLHLTKAMRVLKM